jgi:hypothetical protein
MIKKMMLVIAFVAVMAVLAAGAIQRTSAMTGEDVQASVAAQPGSPAIEAQMDETLALRVDSAAVVVGTLSEEEIAGLLFVREEEKLARDVYLALYAAWDQPVFQNIAKSEQTHMDAVLRLLESYDVADPVLGPGQFTNPDLQALYDQLVAQGSKSLADALKVGAAIEEIDIRDLRERAGQTDEAAIEVVYDRLERASENHLRAFTSTLWRRTGETYQPQYLSAADYQAIVGTSAAGNGNKNGRRGRR